MEPFTIITLPADEISIFFTFLLCTIEDFTSFARIFMVWQSHQTPADIKDVLEKLDWDKVYYQLHSTDLDIRERFPGFLQYCVRLNVTHALHLNSCQELFKFRNVQHNISVLEQISVEYFPSRFTLYFFKAIYRPFELADTAHKMKLILRERWFKSKIKYTISILADINNHLEERKDLLPVFKFCPNARDPDPLYYVGSHRVYNMDVWNSLCKQTVQDPYDAAEYNWKKYLLLDDIFNTECAFCSLQLIVFSILQHIPQF